MKKTALAVLLSVTGLAAACGGSGNAGPGDGISRNTDSPIAGETLRCSGDYPDSVLVFGEDGTLSGRYAGHDVAGTWNATSAGTVEAHVIAGAISVRETLKRSGSGWRGETTSCG